MERQVLRITILLGVLITMLGSTGIFAVLTDRATTGVNDVTSGELGRAVDLQIATAGPHDPQVNPPFDCGTFTDDLATGLFSFTTSAGSGDSKSVCIRNAGVDSVDLTVSAIDLVDLDVACTGDEAAAGDTTCGPDVNEAPQAGELSPSLNVLFLEYECSGGPSVYASQATVAGLGSTPMSLGSLSAGQDRCYVIRVVGSFPDPAAQIAQSDRSEWRFAFDGTVPSN